MLYAGRVGQPADDRARRTCVRRRCEEGAAAARRAAESENGQEGLARAGFTSAGNDGRSALGPVLASRSACRR
jgi:hypothetical protein